MLSYLHGFIYLLNVITLHILHYTTSGSYLRQEYGVVYRYTEHEPSSSYTRELGLQEPLLGVSVIRRVTRVIWVVPGRRDRGAAHQIEQVGQEVHPGRHKEHSPPQHHARL